MKRSIIISLVVVNLLLLAAITVSPDPPKAYGQVAHGAADYLVVTGRYQSNTDALYMIDLARRKMCYFVFDVVQKRMIPYGGRELRRDFPAPPENP